MNLTDLEGEEKFDPAFLGHADRVYEKRVGDWEYTFFEGMKISKA